MLHRSFPPDRAAETAAPSGRRRPLTGAIGASRRKLRRVAARSRPSSSMVALLLFVGVGLDLGAGGSAFGSAAAAASIFLPTFGFEDDVDVIAAWNGQFLVVCEEGDQGTPARVRIIDLDGDTGVPIAVRFELIVPGFEQGVDPIAPNPHGGLGSPVVIPVESADGREAGVVLLLVDDSGNVLEQKLIDLGNLGFRPDVDPIAASYVGLTGFLALESEDGSVRGVLAVDLDPADFPPVGNASGSCVLLTSDGRPGCDASAEVDWLPGLAEGVDPVGYDTGTSVRFVLPVSSWLGSDLLMLDFDNSTEPPTFLRTQSVKAINQTGPRPTDFPGFERDVDLAWFVPGDCGSPDSSLVVPVEGPGNDADLYCLDPDGRARWVLSIDGHLGGLPILGYEEGVDMVPLCGLPNGASSRLALCLENEDGSDADLWMVKLETGELLARAEDGAINPGFTVRGYEVGIEPVRWTDDYLFVALEGADGVGEMVSLDNDATVLDSRVSSTGFGFQRSVDPVVWPLPDGNRTLFVPVQKPDGGDADIYRCAAPPSVHAIASLEALNPGLQIGTLVADLDLGLVEKDLPGQAYLCLPEEDPNGPNARLRFEEVPSPGRYLVWAAASRPPTPAALSFARVSDGIVALQQSDVWGLEAGGDLAHGRGAATPGNPPHLFPLMGTDADSDPTSSRTDPTSAAPAGAEPSRRNLVIVAPNPFSPPGTVTFTLPPGETPAVRIIEASGRAVCRLVATARDRDHFAITWNGRDEDGVRVPAGPYFVEVRRGRALLVSRLLLLP